MRDIINKYKYSIVGGLTGLVLCSLFFTIGFWKTVISLAVIGIGALLGFSKDKDVDVKDYFDDFWSNKKEWK